MQVLLHGRRVSGFQALGFQGLGCRPSGLLVVGEDNEDQNYCGIYSGVFRTECVLVRFQTNLFVPR